jgi:hypothetical protein
MKISVLAIIFTFKLGKTQHFYPYRTPVAIAGGKSQLSARYSDLKIIALSLKALH